MSQNPPYPPHDPGQPGWGQQPPPPGQPRPDSRFGVPPPSLDAVAAIKYGWRAFGEHGAPLVGATALVLLVPVAIQVLGTIVGGGEAVSFAFSAEAGEDPSFDVNGVALVFNLFASVVSFLLSAVLVRLALDVVDGNQVSFGAAFTRINFGQVLIAAIVIGIGSTIGTMLCFLPGIAVVFLTWFTNYFIVAKGEDAISAIRSSISFVSSNAGSMLLLALLSILAMIAGGLACGVGVLVAYPVVTVAAAYTFRYLQGEPIRPMAN